MAGNTTKDKRSSAHDSSVLDTARVEKERDVTARALAQVRVVEGLDEKDAQRARQFLDMAQRYYADSGHFLTLGDHIRAFGAAYYAHAWLDAGVIAGILAGDDPALFMIEK
ncbi:hypothetical protein COV94_00335, partial [Candidatus Woesearchaeota archaeon CG11_big_fil_rev_8_21_14_0_20_57_5]